MKPQWKSARTSAPGMRGKAAALLFAGTACLLLTACAAPSGPRSGALAESWAVRNQAALVEANLAPAPGAYAVRYFEWADASRQREVPAKLYLPPSASADAALPLVVFSHGMGGSREGYSYLGANWAARGYAVLHVQHTGSDSRVWGGNPLDLVSRLQSAASEAEAIHRAGDIAFALDRLAEDPDLAVRVDTRRVLAAGHSYGANTALLASGAVFQRAQGVQSFRDRRIVAAVIISAPPFHGEDDPYAVVRPIDIPTLHITATGDEIRIPGYASGYAERMQLFAATGSTRKALLTFRDGSHSMFTDRLGAGGREFNPLVKSATVALTLAFFEEVLTGNVGALAALSGDYRDVLAGAEFVPQAVQ